MTNRESLHTLIDALPECDLEMAGMLIEWRHRLRDEPLLLTLATAPYDDEPEDSPEEQLLTQEARADIAAGRVYSHAEIVKEFLGSS